METPRDVLIVDDNRDAADSLASLLGLNGFDVRVAYDGRDAIAMALERVPRAVLIDLGMPKIDGYTLLRELRDLPGMADARLICLTGYDDPFHRGQAAEYGCDGYLVKPAELADLQSVLSDDHRPAALPSPTAADGDH
jgi:CheY-like chemotaxis protein